MIFSVVTQMEDNTEYLFYNQHFTKNSFLSMFKGMQNKTLIFGHLFLAFWDSDPKVKYGKFVLQE